RVTSFLNQTLHAYFAAEGIQHQTSVARTPKRNGVVERWNRTLVEAARTMLSAAKSMASAHNNYDPAPTCQTMASAHNSSDPAPTCQKMASVQISSDPVPECQTMALEHGSLSPRQPHAENDEVVDYEFINIFSTPVQDQGETSSRYVDSSNMHTFYQHYPSEQRWTKDHPLEQVIGNPSQSVRTRRQLESNAEMCVFVLTKMASVQISSDPAPECQTMALEHNSLSPKRKCQENVSHGDKTVTISNELDLLFSLMFDELLNGTPKVVSKSSAVSAADAPNQHDEFINIFLTPVQDQGETSSRHVDSLNMHTFYQCYPSEQRWTKDHPLEQVIGNPSQSVRTRR
nr:integrase, catalytic region, zinc finger, CCHC-type, peptidase aspartic, catalytic [Tanacetum cinerariifolium]